MGGERVGAGILEFDFVATGALLAMKMEDYYGLARVRRGLTASFRD